MSQQRLSNDEFLTSLTSLLSSTHAASHGSIFLTQKTLSPTTADTPSSATQVLIRATNGATTTKKAKPGVKVSKDSQHKQKPKIKLATVVELSGIEDFYAKYAEVCKKGMDSMRKRDKKKAKEKAKAAKKKKGNVTSV